MPQARRRKSVRQLVAERAHHRCEYCQITSSVATSAFEIEHITPTAHAGSDDISNMAWSCRRCNSAKGTTTTALDPQNNLPIRLFNPRLDTWLEHFAWDASDDTRVVGKTATGRATIAHLELNRPELLLLRRLLKYEKLHPPPDESPNQLTQ